MMISLRTVIWLADGDTAGPCHRGQYHQALSCRRPGAMCSPSWSINSLSIWRERGVHSCKTTQQMCINYHLPLQRGAAAEAVGKACPSIMGSCLVTLPETAHTICGLSLTHKLTTTKTGMYRVSILTSVGQCLWPLLSSALSKGSHTWQVGVHRHTHSKLVSKNRKWNVKVKSLSRVRLFATPMDYIAYQVPPSMGFSRQEYWSGLRCPPPGDLPNPGIQPQYPALAGGLFTTEPPGKQSSSVTQSCPTLCDPMNHSTPGLPVHH